MSAAPPREPLVLVVDDDAGSRKAMALTLTTDGRRVEEFGDADSALSRAMDDPSVGLVVTDLKMPGKTGIELATELAAARPDVSVLLVTAFGDIETLLKAKDLGTVDYVAKPVARDDLRLRVGVQPGGCSGLIYQLYFDERFLDGDAVADFDGVEVIVDKMSVPYLDGATIDFADTIEQQGFTIDNPNATGSCACGDSFH